MTDREQQPKRLARFVIYVSEEDKRKFKAKLALRGTDASEFFREKMQEEINKPD